jgi:hypothetical protein
LWRNPLRPQSPFAPGFGGEERFEAGTDAASAAICAIA